MRGKGHEIILVDGGSTDGTSTLSELLVDHQLGASPGRAHQMNAGARRASGDILLFLHADTLLPSQADEIIIAGLANSHHCWGRFNVRLSGQNHLLRMVEKLMNSRSRLTGIATGDQAIFIRRNTFEALGGFPEIPLMEDIAFSKRLKTVSSPLCLPQQVISSSRRWEQQGIMQTIYLMWYLRLAYFLGADPGRLAARYRQSETCSTPTPD